MTYRNIHDVRKKITRTYEFISCSYHEAGHVIYALLHLMRVNSVSMYEDKKIKRVSGITLYNCIEDLISIKNTNLFNILVRAELSVNYAGLITEKALFKSVSGSNQTPMFISDGSVSDNKNAREIIKKYNLAPPGQKRAIYKKKISREIQNELYNNWDAVTLVAHALFKRRRLSFDDLLLLTKKTKNKKFWKEQFKKINIIYNNIGNFDENDLMKMLS